MTCHTALLAHNFKTVGVFSGKPVSRCTHCSLTIVDLAVFIARAHGMETPKP